MKVLIINALLKGGGTEVQTLREKKILEENGHSVYLLTFGPETCNESDKCLNIPDTHSRILRVYYRVNIDSVLYKKVSGYIASVAPDVIHINNLQDNAFTILEACKGYRVVKTIRDPGMICPMATCLRPDSSICKGCNFENCFTCLKDKPSRFILYLQRGIIIKQYKKTVGRFVCPSQFLADLSTANGLSTSCINNSFDFTIVKKTDMCFNNTYLYYGYISIDKGVLNLLEAFKKFNIINPCAKLLIAGQLGDVKKETIDQFADNGVTYLGKLSQEQVMELYKNIYCVVVPSIWLENYPNTVLEGIACKTLVLGSNRGGIPELIGDKNLLFNPLDVNDICAKLQYSFNLSTREYENLTQQSYHRVLENNSLEKYYDRIIHIFKGV